ncbi:MAG: YicC family protein, partial [Deltaproteobacteria bacterium]|nr:YicC family protein [Deltaproteobacteria bacterium]
MKSMTAFARAEKTEKEINVLAEIRSYNSRYLDVALRIPHGYAALEEKIKSLIADKVSRGRIEVNLQINDDSDEAYAFEVNISRARAYYESLVQLKDQLDLNSEISIELLLREGGVVRPAEHGRDMVAIGSVVTDCINAAMIDLVAMRQKEGDFIASDISRRIDSIEKSVRQIEKESRDLLFYYQQRLKDRIAVLTKGMVEIDSDRIAQEAAFLADKIDISEEIVRVTSHIKQFLTIMGSKEPAGRKLNFLL